MEYKNSFIKYFILTRLILLLMLPAAAVEVQAQQYSCASNAPVVKIDFGSGEVPDINVYLSKYERDFSKCPRDGFYSYTSHTSQCFNGDWLTINQDHSGNDEGNMMLVNASETGGIFLNTNLNGFTGNTMYKLVVSMMNVCRINGGCAPLPPNVTISVLTPDGKKIGLFQTGRLLQTNTPYWKQFTGYFQTPANATTVKLMMEDETLGGCGNDFAVDDIVITQCKMPEPEVKNEPVVVAQKAEAAQPPVVSKTAAAKPPVFEKDPVKAKPLKRDTTPVAADPVAEKRRTITTPVIKERPVLKLPEPIISRANPIVKQIETEPSDILIALYDNGEIDGDTVTIYHNNQMIVSKAGLSEKPVTFHIKVDKTQSHHELIMVAENLGSIPPNTSMMIITANDKRYEVFISSSEQKNAKVVIELKK